MTLTLSSFRSTYRSFKLPKCNPCERHQPILLYGSASGAADKGLGPQN